MNAIEKVLLAIMAVCIAGMVVCVVMQAYHLYKIHQILYP